MHLFFDEFFYTGCKTDALMNDRIFIEFWQVGKIAIFEERKKIETTLKSDKNMFSFEKFQI